IRPRYELRDELLYVAFVLRQGIRSSKGRQVLKTVQLPQHADVSATTLYQSNSCEVIRGPSGARKRIAMPVDVRAKLATPAENGDLVLEYLIRVDYRLCRGCGEILPDCVRGSGEIREARRQMRPLPLVLADYRGHFRNLAPVERAKKLRVGDVCGARFIGRPCKRASKV